MEGVREWTARTADGESVKVDREDKRWRECGSRQGGQGMEGVWEWTRRTGDGRGMGVDKEDRGRREWTRRTGDGGSGQGGQGMEGMDKVNKGWTEGEDQERQLEGNNQCQLLSDCLIPATLWTEQGKKKE